MRQNAPGVAPRTTKGATPALGREYCGSKEVTLSAATRFGAFGWKRGRGRGRLRLVAPRAETRKSGPAEDFLLRLMLAALAVFSVLSMLGAIDPVRLVTR